MPAKRPRLKRKKRPSGGQSQSLFADLPELQQARALWARNQLIEAIALFDRIVERHPSNVPALADASRAFGALYQYDRAEELLQHVIEIGAESDKALHLAGQSYRLIRRHDQAMQCCRAALKLNPNLADSHLELAILYERRNDLDSAMDHCQARLRINPRDGEARFVEGRILRRRHEFPRAERTLTQVATSPTNHWLTRARCYAELGKLYDQQRMYALAWNSVIKSKALLVPHSTPYRHRRERMIPALQALADQIPSSDFERWRNSGVQLAGKPKGALLTGLPRSGTTLLGTILGTHPDIVTADEFDLFPRILYPMLLEKTRPEEISRAFLEDLATRKRESIQNSRRVLFGSAIPESTQADWLIDKNPSLLPLVAPYHRVFPTDKLVVMLRDPRDVLISCMAAYLPLNDVSVDFLALETAVGRIESDLRIWLSIRDKLPADAWVEVRYEELIRDLRAATSPVLEQLGADWTDKLLDHAQDATPKSVYSPSYVEVAQPVYDNAIGRWRSYQQPLDPYLPILNRLADQLGY